MKLNYNFSKEFLEKLTITKDPEKIDDLLAWPEGQLTFESEKQSTKNFKIEPDIFFWWLDNLIAQFENEHFETYDEDMNGSIYYLYWKNDNLMVYYFDDNENKKIIFQDKISKNDFINLLQKLAQTIKEKMEKTNPDILNHPTWKSYYFVKHYDEKLSKGDLETV